MTSQLPRIYVAIATFYPVPGGAETAALEQGRLLRERGYEATVVTLRLKKEWLPRELIESVPVLRVAGFLLGQRERLPRLLQRLLYLLAFIVMGWTLWRQRGRYDILHVYQLTLLTLPTALVCLLAGKPMVVGVRSADADKPVLGPGGKATLLAGPLDSTTSWLRVEGSIKRGGDLADMERLGRPVVLFAHFLLRRINAVVVVMSSRMRSYLAEHNFILPSTRLIPNGVDIARFALVPADVSRAQRAQTVICVSRLSYEKGIDVLFQAWRLVLMQAPLARLIIVGDGPLQKQLELLAQALDIAHSIEFAGLRRDIAAQLQRGGLAVLPSRIEGMPVALLEAMACGLPCVATRVSGSEDIIEHGVNGLLVESEDYQTMAQALFTLISDPSLGLRYGWAARATVEERYALERTTDMYVALYHSLCTRTVNTSGRMQRKCVA